MIKMRKILNYDFFNFHLFIHSVEPVKKEAVEDTIVKDVAKGAIIKVAVDNVEFNEVE